MEYSKDILFTDETRMVNMKILRDWIKEIAEENVEGEIYIDRNYHVGVRVRSKDYDRLLALAEDAEYLGYMR